MDAEAMMRESIKRLAEVVLPEACNADRARLEIELERFSLAVRRASLQDAKDMIEKAMQPCP